MKIAWDENEKIISAEVEDKICFFEYEINFCILNILYTFVQEEVRERGIANELLINVSKLAAERCYRINPVFSYAVFFYKRYKEFCNLLVDGSLDTSGVCTISRKS